MLSDLRNINTQFRAFDWEHIGLHDETTMEKKKVRFDENRGKGILRTARGKLYEILNSYAVFKIYLEGLEVE